MLKNIVLVRKTEAAITIITITILFMCRKEYTSIQITSPPWGVGGSTEQGEGDLGRHGEMERLLAEVM